MLPGSAKLTGPTPADLRPVGRISLAHPAKQAFEEGLTCAYKIAPAHICTQRAGSVALAAKDMAEAGEVILSDAFHPEYLRPSQAERELKRGTVSNS